jgi:hypothetical protein
MSQPSRSQKEIILGYEQNITRQNFLIKKLKKEKTFISIARLITTIAGITLSWYLWPVTILFISSLIIFSVILFFLVFRDADKTADINNSERLIQINEHEIGAMDHVLNDYEDGHSYNDPIHPYASDLDLFGPSSLFQWLNRCHADQSKKLLAKYLLDPCSPAIVNAKQAAAKELSEMQAYSQQFQSTAMADPVTEKTELKLKNWMAKPVTGFQNSFWKWFRNIYPVFPITILVMFIKDDISIRIFVYWLIGFYFISYLISRKIMSEFVLISNIEQEMNTLYKQFLSIETENFKSPFLQSLQDRLKPAGYSSASASIGDFTAILKKIDWRSHMLLNPILQIFLLWDLRLIILLNEWKKKNQLQISEWFAVIAEMEVTISLASLVYNEPDWCFPEVDEKYFHFTAAAIGHPLIPAVNRVTNDFSMEGTGKVVVITGSNMAGKSTFLRSLGINTVLALLGAPVCAQRMSLSDMKLISSMRVADNLAENSSTFYAELKKLQYIIESVNRKEKVFILLDEVLRGTNSTDRHKGSRALVRQLLQSGTVAVLATHDTELALSESAVNESVTNYHFDAKIVDDELYFDYIIKKGICESLNATTLMKKIGIHFQD